MKTYTSHKEVSAAKIIGFTVTQGGASLVFEEGGQFVDSKYLDRVAPGWGTKDAEVELVGGYYVVYADGYQSWSPPEAFEQGYTVKGEQKGLNVAGYKPTQPAWAIDAVNVFKVLEEQTLRAAEGLPTEGVDGRLLAIGKTQLQGAFMFLARAIFQPQRVKVPGDEGYAEIGR